MMQVKNRFNPELAHLGFSAFSEYDRAEIKARNNIHLK
jgi:hypothetical protein